MAEARHLDADEHAATSPSALKGGNTLSAIARGRDAGTLWAGSGVGRVLVSSGSTRRRSRAAPPSTGTTTWTNSSYDIGDQPLNDAVLDGATGDLYVSTDFSVFRLVKGTLRGSAAADGLSAATVSGLTLASSTRGDRLLYAATHGRGAFRLRLK